MSGKATAHRAVAQLLARARGPAPWERRTDRGEPKKHHDAFLVWRDLPERTFAGVAALVGKSEMTLRRWAKQWAWEERVGPWDLEQQRRRDLDAAEARRKAEIERAKAAARMDERHAAIAARMSQKLGQDVLALTDGPPCETCGRQPVHLDPKVMPQWLAASQRAERIARGLHPEGEAAARAGGGTSVSVSISNTAVFVGGEPIAAVLDEESQLLADELLRRVTGLKGREHEPRPEPREPLSEAELDAIQPLPRGYRDGIGAPGLPQPRANGRGSRAQPGPVGSLDEDGA